MELGNAEIGVCEQSLFINAAYLTYLADNHQARYSYKPQGRSREKDKLTSAGDEINYLVL
jgi:hypothetical protein